jgi:putative chitinase
MNLAAKMGAGIHADALMAAASRWGILAVEDQARWLAQCKVESAGFLKLVESLNYRPERLLAVFKGRNGINTLSIATQIVAAGQPAIANAIYGGTWGLKNLGNSEPGDGWKFRGAGFMHTTGRANFKMTSMEVYGDERLLDKPELLQQPEGAANAAAWFWHSRKLNGVTDVQIITKRINGGLNALQERIDATRQALELAHA